MNDDNSRLVYSTDSGRIKQFLIASVNFIVPVVILLWFTVMIRTLKARSAFAVVCAGVYSS